MFSIFAPPSAVRMPISGDVARWLGVDVKAAGVVGICLTGFIGAFDDSTVVGFASKPRQNASAQSNDKNK